SLKKAVERKDELAEEIRQVRKLQGKVLELEGLSVPKPEFSNEVARLKADLSSLKSATSVSSIGLHSSTSSLANSLAKLTRDLTEFGARLNSLVTQAVVKDDISSFTERIESSSQEISRGFSSLKRDVDKKVSFVSSFEEKLSSLGEKFAAAENAIAAINENLSRKFVDKHNFEKSLTELRSKLNETKQLIESSMSEVNLDDYVTKRLLKSQLDSLQKDAGKQHEKDVSKLREEIERFWSEFAQFGDFASKLDRLQRSSEDAWNDAKKEIKRQRELFEERLRSLESYYRSSNDSLKAELDELRSQIKSLSKADAAAKVEMAKITTSAAKVAAKTAAELIEEAEEEAKEVREVGEGRRGKGLSPLAVSIIIVALLVFGSVAYVVIKGSGEAIKVAPAINVTVTENVTLPLPEIIPAPEPAPVPEEKPQPYVTRPSEISPITPTPVPVAANVSENISEVVANVSANVSQPQPPRPEVNVSNVSVEPVLTLEERNEKCKEELECTKRSAVEYWFDCYFDESNQQCRCFVGTIDNCPHLKKAEEVEQPNLTNATAAPVEVKGEAVSSWYYALVAFVVFVVLFFAYRTLFVKEEKEKPEKEAERQRRDEKEPKESKAEKTAKKQEKEKEKPSKVESEEDEDVIDLEEFFEKK
ncbi:MAG: hypothetical protein AABX69_00195, partial [Nanoarchaeota archaeon]